jgi:hypothetical protein
LEQIPAARVIDAKSAPRRRIPQQYGAFMQAKPLAKFLGAFILAASLTTPLAAQAQGTVQGAQRGAAQGERDAGPIGAVVGGTLGAVAGTVGGLLGVQDQPRFRTYVVEQNIPSYQYESDLRVGAVMPETGVTYYDVPAEYHVSGYRYTYVNNHAVLVDPRTRAVVQIVN